MAYPPALPPSMPGASLPSGGVPPPMAAAPMLVSALPPLAPLAPEELAQWWTRVDLARTRRKRELDKWKQYLQAYLPADAGTDTINSNIHFRNVHLKIAEMWAQLPEIMLSPLEPLDGIVDPQTGQPMPAEEIVAVKRAVLNKLLGRDHANVNQTVLTALFDVFATAGLGPTKICYEADIKQVPAQPAPQMPGQVLGLKADIPASQPVAVHERWRWYRFSPSKFLQPHDATATDFDEAAWLGMEFVEPLTPASRQRYHLPDDFQSNVTKDDLVLTADTNATSGAGSDALIKGVELWLKAAIYDPQEANSQVYYRLVLIEGQREQPGAYERSPYQTIGPDGKLTADSMIGNPIHPQVLRTMSDSAWPPADAAFTDPLVKQMNTWRAQDIKQRDANLQRFVHSDAITTAIDKLKDADTGQGIAIPDEQMSKGIAKLIAPIPHLERAQADIQGEASIRQNLDETLGLGANQAGSLSRTVRSATEQAIVQQNVSVRLKAEQTALMEWWLRGVRKFDSLVQRYATDATYVEIVGQAGDRRLQLWNQHVIGGRYAYDAKPDTQLTMDPQARRKAFLDFTNFFAKSPFMNQQELSRQGCLEFGYDPARMTQQPSPPPPEKPKVSFTFNGADLSIPEVRTILQGAGIQLPPAPSPEAITATLAANAKKQPHGGAADRAETLSQHHGELTGNLAGRPHLAQPVAAAPGVQ